MDYVSPLTATEGAFFAKDRWQTAEGRCSQFLKDKRLFLFYPSSVFPDSRNIFFSTIIFLLFYLVFIYLFINFTVQK